MLNFFFYYFQRAKRGQFSVVFNLFKLIPEAQEAKAHVDHIIDLCGVPPIGAVKIGWRSQILSSHYTKVLNVVIFCF